MPAVLVVPVAPAAFVAPSVDDVAAGAADEAFAPGLASASEVRVVVEKSICIVSVPVSVNESWLGGKIAFQFVYGIRHTKLEYRGPTDLAEDRRF
ncbi:hypothetical protein [Burkholderia cepacia]|uniref:hypothetical protein n=1 Tax=Burkholderia cepacia TaxID=292 RepID=UPI0021AB2BC8|nr:hypothetical protein [Burkholderia cepacia]